MALPLHPIETTGFMAYGSGILVECSTDTTRRIRMFPESANTLLAIQGTIIDLRGVELIAGSLICPPPFLYVSIVHHTERSPA